MKITCPICKKQTTWEENPWRPFCSERCKLIDLGKWVSEEYRIEGEEVKSKDQNAGREEQNMEDHYDKSNSCRSYRKNGKQDYSPFKGIS